MANAQDNAITASPSSSMNKALANNNFELGHAEETGPTQPFYEKKLHCNDFSSLTLWYC